MNRDNKLKYYIKKGLDEELKDIKLHRESKDKIMEIVSKKQGIFKRFLEYEVVIPVKSVVAVFTAFFIGIGYITYPAIKVSESDIVRSKIEVIRLSERR